MSIFSFISSLFRTEPDNSRYTQLKHESLAIGQSPSLYERDIAHILNSVQTSHSQIDEKLNKHFVPIIEALIDLRDSKSPTAVDVAASPGMEKHFNQLLTGIKAAIKESESAIVNRVAGSMMKQSPQGTPVAAPIAELKTIAADVYREYLKTLESKYPHITRQAGSKVRKPLTRFESGGQFLYIFHLDCKDNKNGRSLSEALEFCDSVVPGLQKPSQIAIFVSGSPVTEPMFIQGFKRDVWVYNLASLPDIVRTWSAFAEAGVNNTDEGKLEPASASQPGDRGDRGEQIAEGAKAEERVSEQGEAEEFEELEKQAAGDAAQENDSSADDDLPI